MGYKARRVNGIKKDVHRLVMEKHLGRKLTTLEVVHHVDNNKSNNDIRNLFLCPNKAGHTKLHINQGDLKLKCGSNKKELLPNGKIRCFKCEVVKPISEFEKQKGAYLGIKGTCKNCRNKRRMLTVS